MRIYLEEEKADALKNVARILDESGATISTMTQKGTYGRNGHQTLLVSVIVVRDWNGSPCPTNISGTVATALGWPVKWRKGMFGIPVQSGGADADEVFHAICRMMGEDPYSGKYQHNRI